MTKYDFTVDKFSTTHYATEYQDIVATIREWMREWAPQATEVISYGIPAWRVTNIIAVLNPAKAHLTLAFSRGVEFTDKWGLLEGVGKVSKNVRFRKYSDLNKEALHDYVTQALALDAK